MYIHDIPELPFFMDKMAHGKLHLENRLIKHTDVYTADFTINIR